MESLMKINDPNFVSSDSNRFYLVHDCAWCGDGIFL